MIEPDLRRMLMDHVLERCSNQLEGDGCIVWPGRFSRGYPYVRISGKDYNITRLMIEAASDRAFPTGYGIRPSCGNTRCIRFTHLEIRKIVGLVQAKTKADTADLRARLDAAWAERAQSIPEGACRDCGTFCAGDVQRCVGAMHELLVYMAKTVGTDDRAA